jgi:DNA-binding response OmpR family regulator
MNNCKRVLLVDDEEVITFGFSRVLQAPDVCVDTAQTLEAAKTLIEASQYRAAIVDLRLSNSIEIEGFSCIRLLREHQKDCKIIVLTAYGDNRLREQANELGVDLFLIKPMEPEKIKQILVTYDVYSD